MSKDTGGQAFPTYHEFDPHRGMTLRDYFAAKAMQTLANDLSVPWIAERAYEIADAMLVARKDSKRSGV